MGSPLQTIAQIQIEIKSICACNYIRTVTLRRYTLRAEAGVFQKIKKGAETKTKSGGIIN